MTIRREGKYTLQIGANLKKLSRSGIGSANRTYEGGIASNRISGRYGEYVPDFVHTARHATGVGSNLNGANFVIS